MLELLITLEIIGFIFLALGITPFKAIRDSGNSPLANKVLFIFVSIIIFSSLALISVSFDYTYCFVNETVSTGLQMSNTATCSVYKIEDLNLSYINWGLSILSLIIGVITILIAAVSKNDNQYNE